MGTDQHIPNLWGQLPVRLDRSPNELNGIPQLFEASMNFSHSMNNSDPELFQTEFGNINGGGSPTSFSSPILGMKNPKLGFALEPNIAPLVELLGDLDLVTYSSCEGHFIEGSFYEGYAGIVFLQQHNFLIEALLYAGRAEGFSPYRTWLTDVDDRKRYPTVEIYFPQRYDNEVTQYHEQMKQATKRLKRSLEDKGWKTR